MILNQTNWDDDLPIDPQEAYQDLLCALERKLGFGLYFVQCNPIESDHFVNKSPPIYLKKDSVITFS